MTESPRPGGRDRTGRLPVWRWILGIAMFCIGAGYSVMAVIDWARPSSNPRVDELYPYVSLLNIVVLPLIAWLNHRSE